jgi:hypothetical protein
MVSIIDLTECCACPLRVVGEEFAMVTLGGRAGGGSDDYQ